MDGNRNARTHLTGLTDQTLHRMQKGEILMKWNRMKTLAVVGTALLILLFAGQAMAAGTAANTTISNTANVEFTLDGVTSGPIPSETVTFLVDERIDVVVDNNDGGNVQVVAGSNDQVLDFTVTNNSNTEAGGSTWFKLTTVAGATPADDEFDMNSVEIWQDTDNDGIGDVNLTQAAIDAGESNVYIQLAVDAHMDLVIVSDTPNTATTRTIDQTADYWLVAQAWDAGTDTGSSALTTDSGGGGNDPDAVEIVLDDAAGAVSGDIAADGKHSALGTYITITPVTIAKVAGDGNTSGYHIPGDTVTYTVTVTNNASTSATAVEISDAIPANTYYSSGLACSASGTGSGGTPEWSVNNGTSWLGSAPADLTTVTDVHCTGGTIDGSAGTATMTFIVEIQ